ncbi:tumor necrosis factor receptor superfamily member 25 isoform X3 [Elephas maximus indicus]|uniref:tumor necrosis factor receptor superfamily member 25 isoform X3 n=1 Tax=Elephas maximus indicus TaxID=99487 RepID=UPI002115EDB6|nr:tumor necrosis factor receptor superfamily member 25 isoform X3 [Elephas maximus indicus]
MRDLPRGRQVVGAQVGELQGMAAPRPGPHTEAGSQRRRGAGPAGGRGAGRQSGKPGAGQRTPSEGAAQSMEPRPRGCAAVAVALLMVLLGAQGQGSTPSPGCDCAGDAQKRNGLFCCRGCPAGHYLKAPCTKPCGAATCLPCPQGTFLARKNHHETRCARCQACDEQASQVALENCSAVADTRCGCEPGWFLECSVRQCSAGSHFHCRPCSDCEALHRHTVVPCSGRDTDCGSCLPGFYEHGDGCAPCPTSTPGSCPEPCATVCGWRQMFWVQVLLPALVVPLLLGATLTCTYRCYQPRKPVIPADEAGMEALNPLQATHPSSPGSTHTLLAPPGSNEKVCTVQLVGNSWTPDTPQTQEAACPEVPWSWDQLTSRALGPPLASALPPAPPAGSAVATLQPGPQLYDVMDAVPARRWKEFVRTLGLRETEIEAVEVEVGRFRDQQYEMLKRWRQQQPAGLGAVYAALERMGLDGCAEDLRSRLQRGP